MLYPLTFHPIFKERIWGGREIEKLYGKKLPAGKRIGESWEISDRPNDESIIANGKFVGKSLRWLMETFSGEILGGSCVGPAGGDLIHEIIAAMQKDNERRSAERSAEIDRRMGQVLEAITQLGHIAESHDHRLDNLEDRPH